MRRILLPAAFAVAFHGWLLSSQSAWFLPDASPLPLRRTVSISLAAAPVRQPPAARTAPEEEIEPAPPPVPQQRVNPKPEPAPASRPVKSIAAPEAPVPEKPVQKPPPPPPEFSSLFDALDPPAEAPLIPEGIAALSDDTDEAQPLSAATGAVDEAPVDSGPALIEARPLYRENPPPEYPRLARRRGYEGTVLLEVLVDEAGRVKELKLAESSGHAALDRAAEKSVKRWRFTAGRRGEDPVQMWVKVPVRFELR